MALSLSRYPIFLVVLTYPFLCLMSKATDTLKPGDEVRNNKTLVSSNDMFELGFFTAGINYYLGTWFKNDPSKKPIWLASREYPLLDSEGVLTIRYDGNLVMVDRRQIPILVNPDMLAMANNTIAVLLDSGNFVLKEGENVVWESFSDPTDTLLPGMKLGWFNLGTIHERQQYLTSWQSPYVPSTGSFVLALYRNNKTEMKIWQRNGVSIKIGNWDGNRFRFLPNSSLNYYNCSYVSNSDEVYFTFEIQRNDSISWLVMSHSGEIELFTMNKDSNSISMVNNYICEGANAENFTSCFIERPVTCEEGNNFFEMKGLMPNITSTNDSVHLGISDCEIACTNNCSCAGFTTFRGDDGTGCVFYYGDSDVFASLSGQGNRTIFVRRSDKRTGVDDISKSNTVKMRLLWLIVIVPVTLIIAAFIFNRREGAHICVASQKRQNSIKRNLEMFLHQHGSAEVDNLTSSSDKFKFSKKRDQELPIISFSYIATATNNFSVANELGEGGFGHVYKGVLMGLEIAVKRLSQRSFQGLEEFRNEVQLISRLQHRNLVRLLGCCIEKDEKILIYEYMVNKSLDSFLFDPRKKSLLDWDRRMHIIEGVAQGLLYLHKYSRLRIIHRDLKTSNILLDNDMNPKISDFGMARIFRENEARARTTRVVGTYGYMSPEYAVRGLFSTKSDVFSFGVIMLEIISGRKNTTFSDPEISLSLLGHAWEMWKAGRGMEFADAVIVSTCSASEVSQCLHIALLCIQERPEDRPNMSDVVSMLSNESSNFPIPKQLAFYSLSSYFNSSMQHDSIANVSALSILEGR